MKLFYETFLYQTVPQVFITRFFIILSTPNYHIKSNIIFICYSKYYTILSMNSKSKLSYKNRFAKLVLTFQKSCSYLYSKTSKVQPLYTTPHLTAPNTDYRLKKRRRLFPCWATGERSRANTDYEQILYDHNLHPKLQYSFNLEVA